MKCELSKNMNTTDCNLNCNICQIYQIMARCLKDVKVFDWKLTSEKSAPKNIWRETFPDDLEQQFIISFLSQYGH